MITRGTTISGNLHIQPNCIKLQRKRNREDPLRNLLAHVGPRKNSGRGRLLFQSQSLGHWHSRVEGPASPCHAKPPRHVEFETHRSGFHLWYIAYTVLTGLISGRSWNIIWTFPKVQKWMLWSAYIITIYHISYYISLPNIIQQHLSSEKNQVIFVDGPSVVVKSDPPRSFTFDGVLGETSTQQVGVRAGIFLGVGIVA